MFVLMCVPQAKSAENILRHRPHWLFKLGSGYLSGGCMGHLLLLHLEGSQIYRQGESSSPFISADGLIRIAIWYCVVGYLPTHEERKHLKTSSVPVSTTLEQTHESSNDQMWLWDAAVWYCSYRWFTSPPPFRMPCYWSCWSEGSPYQGPPGESTSTSTLTWGDCLTRR